MEETLIASDEHLLAMELYLHNLFCVVSGGEICVYVSVFHGLYFHFRSR